MIKPTRYCLCASAFLAVALPHWGGAQGIGSSVFSDGGGLLLEPTDLAPPVAGTLTPAPAGGAGDAGPRGPTGGRQTDPNGGRLVTLGLSLGYVYDDDEDAALESFTVLGLTAGVLSETRNQTFDLNFGVDLEIGNDVGANDEIALVDPAFTLGYTLQNRNTFFGTDLIWRAADVGDTFLPAAFDGEDLAIDGGTRETHEARFRLETGRAARFGTSSRLEFRQIDFTDTIDPELVNVTRFLASTELSFALDRRVELRSFASFTREEEDDAVQTSDTDIRYGVGIDVLIDRAWTGSLDVALTDEEVETTAGTTQTNGFDITASTTRFLTNGRLTFSARYEEEVGTRLTTVDAFRALELANGAALTGSLGVAVFDNGDVVPTASFSYAREILRGQSLAFSLTREGGFDDDEAGVLRTVFNANYNHDLTRRSRLGVSAALAGLDERDAGETTLAASFGVSYSHDLTADWAVVARADTRQNFVDGDRTDQSNRFSINLERTFSFRP